MTDANKNIFGVRGEEHSTLASINKVIKYLENCNKEWLEHIDSKRNQYPLLNYFTLDQLVILREELTKINFDTRTKEVEREKFRNLIDLLFNLNESVDLDMMLSAHEFACDEMSTNNSRKQRSDDTLMDTDNDKQDEVNTVIDNLVKDWGFSKALIRQAIKSCRGFQDIDELVQYCLHNEEEEVKEIDSLVSLSTQLADNFNCNIEGKNSLEDQINELWIKFKQLLDKNLTELLCLNHLGYFLKHLKEKSGKKTCRQKPPYLEAGLPNLVVCDNWEIIPRVLNLYMFSPEQPLPNDDEIIFCTETTKASEIEIFLRRAVGKVDDDSDKVYCLVNVQNLEYDQAVKVAISYENLNKRRDFVLCIFCSQEKADKSVLATSFYRHKKKLNENLNLPEIEVYLRNKFINRHAAMEDFSLKVFKSNRSGVGKSLKIKRLYEHVQQRVDQNAKYCCISIKKRDLNVEEIFSNFKEFDRKNHLMTRVWHIGNCVFSNY